MQCARNTGPDRGSILYSRSKNYVNIFIDLRAKKFHLLGKILSGFFVAKFFSKDDLHNLAHWIIGLQKLNTAFRMITLFAFYPFRD